MVSLPRIKQQVPNVCAILAGLMAKSACFQVLSFLRVTLGKAGVFVCVFSRQPYVIMFN